MLTGSEVVMAPPLSVAFAVKTYWPAGTLAQVRQNGLAGPTLIGLLVLIPRLLAPAKNSTVATNPSTSRASAQILILAGAVKVVPFVGTAIRTVGGIFVPSLS